MSEDVVRGSDEPNGSWGRNVPAVRKALAFLRRKPRTPQELVDFDRTHGRRLFEWDDTEAAADWRMHQARLFINAFRSTTDGMRMRAFVHIHEDEEAGVTQSGYVSIEAIARDVSMREQVVSDITRRMATLASELRMWNLSPSEQATLFERLRVAIGIKQVA